MTPPAISIAHEVVHRSGIFHAHFARHTGNPPYSLAVSGVVKV